MDNTRSTFVILQLARLGDIVQTYQSALDFKNQHPEVRLVLVARKSFAEPLFFLLKNVFDQIIQIDPSQLVSEGVENLEQLMLRSEELLARINQEECDVLINFSFCRTSNYLASCIRTKHRLGTFIDKNNLVTVHDQWSQVVHTMTQRGPYCPYNLVDLFKNTLGIKPHITNPPPQTKKKENILAMHPFTSHEKKHWDIKKWVEVIYSFLKNNPTYKVYLFGSKTDVDNMKLLREEPILQKFSKRIYSLVGKLTLEESFNKLADCKFFIGHDSLIGHLAKVAQLPTLTISLGTVREIETVPYGENSYVVSPKTNCFPCFPDTKCDFFKCHSDISHQAISGLINSFVNNGELSYQAIKDHISPFHLSSFNVFKGDFTNAGWMYLKDITENELRVRDIFKVFLRVSFSYKLEEVEENFPVPNLSASAYGRLKELKNGIKQLYELCEFGKKYSHYILQELVKENPSIEAIKDHSSKIEEIDNLMDLVRKTYGELAPVIDYYKVTKSNLIGSSLVEITESSYLVYNDNASVCSLLFELIDSTLSKSKHGHNQLTKEPKKDV